MQSVLCSVKHKLYCMCLVLLSQKNFNYRIVSCTVGWQIILQMSSSPTPFYSRVTKSRIPRPMKISKEEIPQPLWVAHVSALVLTQTRSNFCFLERILSVLVFVHCLFSWQGAQLKRVCLCLLWTPSLQISIYGIIRLSISSEVCNYIGKIQSLFSLSFFLAPAHLTITERIIKLIRFNW